MGREIRKVPANWEHPKNEKGKYIPLLNGNFYEFLAEWEEGKEQWDKGYYKCYNSKNWEPKEKTMNYSYEEWNGDKPKLEDYMPQWSEDEKTHIQLYEDTSEGTPLTEVYKPEDIDKLCEYAAENCTIFATYKLTKDEWKEKIKSELLDYSSGSLLFI